MIEGKDLRDNGFRLLWVSGNQAVHISKSRFMGLDMFVPLRYRNAYWETEPINIPLRVIAFLITLVIMSASFVSFAVSISKNRSMLRIIIRFPHL